MNLADGHLMDEGFRFAKTLKQRLRTVAGRRRQPGAIDQREDLGQAPVRMHALAIVGVRGGVIMIVGVRVPLIVLVMIMAGAGCVVQGAVLEHDELRGREACTKDTPRADVEPRHGQTSERALQILQWEPGID